MPTFDTPAAISVTVELSVGDLRVNATDRTDTVVEVRPSDPGKKADVAAAEQTRVEYANGSLLIKTPTGWRPFGPRKGAELGRHSRQRACRVAGTCHLRHRLVALRRPAR